jgi:type I restriction-modification system DNA methylase subunit
MSVRNTVKSIQDIMRQDAGVDGDAQRISQLCWMFFLKIMDDQDQELELTARPTSRRSRRNSSGAVGRPIPKGSPAMHC